MARDVDGDALETLLGEFSTWFRQKRSERLKGYKTAPPAPAEGDASPACEDCKRGECANPEHMGEDMAEGLEASLGESEPPAMEKEPEASEHSAPDAKRKKLLERDSW
jgi:hypothetical protein